VRSDCQLFGGAIKFNHKAMECITAIAMECTTTIAMECTTTAIVLTTTNFLANKYFLTLL